MQSSASEAQALLLALSQTADVTASDFPKVVAYLENYKACHIQSPSDVGIDCMHGQLAVQFTSCFSSALQIRALPAEGRRKLLDTASPGWVQELQGVSSSREAMTSTTLLQIIK
jgi:hypothetical protein